METAQIILAGFGVILFGMPNFSFFKTPTDRETSVPADTPGIVSVLFWIGLLIFGVALVLDIAGYQGPRNPSALHPLPLKLAVTGSILIAIAGLTYLARTILRLLKTGAMLAPIRILGAALMISALVIEIVLIQSKACNC